MDPSPLAKHTPAAHSTTPLHPTASPHLQEMYEHRIRSFLTHHAISSSGAWNRAVEALAQLNPSSMIDLDTDMGESDKLASLGTLLRNVATELSNGGRQARIKSLQELAQQSPQALCSIALHVPFDVLVRELEGVIYEQIGSDVAQGGLETTSQSTAPMVPPKLDHSWHGEMVLVSPPSPRSGQGRKGSVRSVLARAGESILGRGESSKHGAVQMKKEPHSAHVLGHDRYVGEERPIDDRTWHGTKVSKEQLDTGTYEYSEVPRHGALRPTQSFRARRLQIALRPGMMDALQVILCVCSELWVHM